MRSARSSVQAHRGADFDLMIEKRRAELRAAPGRRLVGRAMPYGAEALARVPGVGVVRERFATFAFSDYLATGAATLLNLQHDRTLTIASTAGATRSRGALVLRDHPDGLDLEARFPSGDVFDQVLDLVARGDTAETSVEFRAIQSVVAGNRRVVQVATLPAIGIVDKGAYRTAVEVRAAARKVSGMIVPGWQRIMACRCQGKDCDSVSFDAGAFDASLADADREILAVGGSYEAPLASRRRGTLRVQSGDEGLSVDLTLPDSEAGRAVREAAEAADVFARPYIDLTRSEYVDEGEAPHRTRRFTRAWLRAVIVGATDAAEGLAPLALGEAKRAARRVVRPWL